MNLIVLIAVLLFAAVVAFLLLVTDKHQTVSKADTKSYGPRPVATAREQAMFWRITEVFPYPDYLVMKEMSFGALLEAQGGASRNSFSQKRADFVLLNRDFKVLAVIEIDDHSHKGKEAADQQRDQMLISAGYKVLRYPNIPHRDKLARDML